MVETLTKTNICNSFGVFREIMQGITALTSISSSDKTNVYPWLSDSHYFEDEPNEKGRDWKGYPVMVIDTEITDERLTLNGAKKKFELVTEIEIRTEYLARTTSAGVDRNNSYADAIINYFNANHASTIYPTYGITNMTIDKERNIRVIAEKKVVITKLTFRYRRILSVL